MGRSVVQEWLSDIPMMQQTVLLTCVRGPDGMPKYSSPKYIVRWLRRSILLSATDGKILTRPGEEGGGSFTGPSLDKDWTEWEIMVKDRVDDFVRDEDCIPGHFMDHVRNASQILGFKHPDLRIRAWWRGFHLRLVNLKHLHPETEEEMDKRLGDTLEGWKERGDAATER